MQFQISTLIFDMDGVITDTMPYHFRAWKSVFASEGIEQAMKIFINVKAKRNR